MEYTTDQLVAIERTKFIRASEDIQAIDNAGKALKKDPSSLLNFQAKVSNVDKLFDSAMAHWDKLLELSVIVPEKGIPTADDKSNYELVTKWFYRIKETALAHEPSPRRSTGFGNGLNNTSMSATRVRLPKITLPEFSGKFSEWPIFRDTYTSLIHEEATLTDIDKFHYLVGRLKGVALDSIKSIPITDGNYEQAWTTLQRTFDSKRRLASSYIQKLLTFSPMKGKPTLASLNSFLNHVAESVSSLQNLKVPNTGDFILFELAIRGLDPTTREAFEVAHITTEFPSFSELVNFVQQRCLALSMFTDQTENPASTHTADSPPARRKEKHVSFFTNQPEEPSNTDTSSPRTTLSCAVCSNEHKIKDCVAFKNLLPQERYDRLKEWKGCYNCLIPGHRSGQCRSPFCCRICNRRHHTLLHASPLGSSPATPPSAERVPPTSPQTGSALTGMASQSPQVLLGTAKALIKDAEGHFIPIRLIIDSGSQFSFITESFVKRLGISSLPLRQKIIGIGESALGGAVGRAVCHLTSIKEPVTHFSTTAIIVSTIAPLLPQTILPAAIKDSFLNSDLEMADPDFWYPNTVDFLLGADLFGSILRSLRTYQPNRGQPYALPTVFGAVIMGPFSPEKENTSSPISSFFVNLDSEIQRFWELEEPNVPTPENSVDDDICERHFRDTHYRTSSGRYVVSLPFKSAPTLGPSKGQAINRLVNLERKLTRSPVIREQYSAFMQEYLSLGHMSPATANGTFIIPHHAVTKDDRKLRVVFDGSASTSLGSVNDQLLIGPKLQKDIGTIMLNFRRHAVVFTADIVKMYRQILVNPCDRTYQHILWRESVDHEIREYELNTVTYGLTSSPFQALRVIKQLVLDEGINFPKASKALLSDIYVDDIVTGADSEQDARALQQELIKLLDKGGFTLSKWSANKESLLDSISNPNNRVVTFDADHDSQVKVLGIQWDPVSDVFRYRITLPPVTDSALSKRVILSTIARIYDPLGYLAPLIFQGKRILQATWASTVGWDDTVPVEIATAWHTLVAELHHLNDLAIPRHLPTPMDVDLSIVGFCDASERGYCAALYLRHSLHSGKYVCNLIKAKTRLAPLKTVSVPRLELCAAVLLTQLYSSITEFCQNLPPYDTYFFSDSTIVLHWLKTSPHLLKTFVANRVTEITCKIPSEWWRHVRSADNAADCGSRGLMPRELSEHSLWWHGPDWLSFPKVDWPSADLPTRPTNLPELKDIATFTLLSTDTAAHEILSLTDRISSYAKLVRVTAYVLRFRHNLRHIQKERRSGPITGLEFKDANLTFIKALQQNTYGDHSKHSSLFRSLNVFQHSDGLLRVGGRLTNSSLPFGQKHPILLPKRCEFNNLLIDHHHRIHMHVGPTALQAILFQTYWIPAARNLIKERTFKCAHCYKILKNPHPPFMGDLPESRVTGLRAFIHTGVDFAGPFPCRTSTRRNSAITKSYLCVYVCMTTKAIHLEVVTDLSTAAFLASFDRFVSRRGLPAKVHSDCGKNFVGAARQLKELSDWHADPQTQTSILNHVAPRNIEWLFNPPYSPHFGGLWEASVKMTKSLLYRTLGSRSFTIEELITVFTKIEAVLNSRPISPMSSDPNDLQPLTPGHFLVGGPLTALPEPNLLDINQYRLSKWQQLNQITQTFWQRWRTEYLHTLQTRKKWTSSPTNLEVGDLVIIKEKNLAPLQWPTARIAAVHPGKDGVVRVATVRTTSGEFLRPVTNLVSLRPLTHAEISKESPGSPLDQNKN